MGWEDAPAFLHLLDASWECLVLELKWLRYWGDWVEFLSFESPDNGISVRLFPTHSANNSLPVSSCGRLNNGIFRRIRWQSLRSRDDKQIEIVEVREAGSERESRLQLCYMSVWILRQRCSGVFELWLETLLPWGVHQEVALDKPYLPHLQSFYYQLLSN